MKRATLALLAAVALAAPASASANQWYLQVGSHGARRRLAPGESAEVATFGTWYLKLRLGENGDAKATCAESGIELLTNPTREKALDSTLGVKLACNDKVVATSVLLPWTGAVESNCQPCTITRLMSFEIAVAGVDYGVFTGDVLGRIGDFDPPIRDDIDHAYRWEGTNGGVMTSESGATLAIGGGETYGLSGDEADGEPDTGGTLEEEGITERRRNEARKRAGLKGDGDDNPGEYEAEEAGS